MSSKIRNVALLLPAFVLATGLASAQPTVGTINSDGTVTKTQIGPTSKAPTAAPDGSAKYWDGLGIGGASTNYFSQVPYITATPNPQIATGPDDILTIVNRTISRYPNPNAAGNTGTLNPYNYPPTEFVPLDVWMGLTVLGGNTSATALCPSGTGSNSSCVIDNASIRYDQLQGRFLVLFTVTDLPLHRSNWVLVISAFSQFQRCPVPSPAGNVCPASSPLFTPPVIAPIVGGNQTGGVNPGPNGGAGGWYLYTIPINLLYNPGQQPNALGLINNPAAIVPFNNPLANSAVGTPNPVTTGGQTATFLTVPFCPNGGPAANALGLTFGIGGTARTCTNYYPTGARFGIDNDNIILTAPILDMAFAPNEGSFPSTVGQRLGPYAGTRVTTVPKLVVFNGTALGQVQPPACLPTCGAVNLADNTATGTLTAITTKVAFGFGLVNGPGAANGDLIYGGGSPALPNSCITANPVAVTAQPFQPGVPPPPPGPPAQTQANIVLSCAPVNVSTVAGSPANNSQGTSTNAPFTNLNSVTQQTGSSGDLPAIYWEPDNLRGRALASFDAQVAPFSNLNVAGVITPIDYLVGTEITDNFGQGIVRSGVRGFTGQSTTQATVNVVNFNNVPGAFQVITDLAGAALLAARPNAGVGLVLNNGSGAVISSPVQVGNTTISVTANPFPNFPGTALPATATFVSFAIPGFNNNGGSNNIPATPGIATFYYLQSITFSCPGSNGLISDFTNCFTGANGTQSVVAEIPFFGKFFSNVSTLAEVADPAPVGQGFGPGVDVTGKLGTQLTTSPTNVPVTSVADKRIFVGDSRPTQVLFREGLLYISRNVRLADQQINWLGTSTVLYDILKTCATLSASPAASTCGNYSINGQNLTNPALAFEYEWFNGLNVPDPAGDVLGFGFYQPMFEAPADVNPNGPISPINALQVFDKLFVGMTTGGTSNTLGTFSRDYPSLWDFRPGDDAYDTVQPYLDPYTGNVLGTYVCGASVTQPATTVSVTATQITAGSPIVTLNNVAGLAIGQTVQTGTPVIASVNPATGGTSNASTTPVGNAQTTAFTCIGPADAAGCPAAAVSLTTFGILSSTNVGVGEAVVGRRGPSVTTINTFNLGATTITVPNTTQVAVGEQITGTGLSQTVITNGITNGQVNTFVTGVQVDAFNNLVVTFFPAANGIGCPAGGCNTVVFDSTPCFGPFNNNPNATTQRVQAVSAISAFVLGTTLPSASYNGTLACTSYFANSTNGSSGGGLTPQATIPQLNGLVIDNGIPVQFLATNIVSGAIINIGGNTVTLANNASNPLPGQPIPGAPAATLTSNIPINFNNGGGSSATVTCPIIPFSPRGGASTDPNDGSLWLYGEFAKNRLSTIPGPGQWGTSVANYALSFPAVDPYGNDNTYFQDVQPVGSPNSSFFTWIQLAKVLGLAVPSATGPCTINNGNTPILQPPGSGGLPQPGTSTLGCPYFAPDATVTRAEMAYWIVKAQMDETMITNYLCATGGDPSGLSAACNGALPASSFADLGAAGGSILNPFLGANPALGIAGVTNAQLMRYIEVMVRRGYTKGCNSTIDPLFKYCPNDPVTRAQMSVFIIRAKMNNVFPTTLSGLPLASPYGDNFGTFLPPTPYFSDVTQNDPVFGPYYIYIQKMRELRITNGTGGATFSPGNNLTRKEIATFVVRAFFL